MVQFFVAMCLQITPQYIWIETQGMSSLSIFQPCNIYYREYGVGLSPYWYYSITRLPQHCNGDVVALRGCGGSLVVHQTVKPAVPRWNLSSLQPAGTCHSLLGSQQGWHETAGWPLRGGRGKKIQKYKKIIIKKTL